MFTVTVERDELRRALQALKPCSGGKRRARLPELEGVLISVANGTLTLTVSNLDIWASARFPGEGEGECLVTSFRDFHAWVRALDKGEVAIEWDGNSTRLRVRQGDDICDFAVYPANDFPRAPGHDWQTVFRVDDYIFREAVRKTSYAASTDLARPELCALYIMAEPGGVTFVAADGFRLSEFQMDAPVEATGRWLVDVKMMELAARYAGARVTLQVDGEKCARVITGNLTYTTYLTEGQYPDYERIIPDLETYPVRVMAERAALLKAVKRARKLDAAIVFFEASEEGLCLRAPNGNTTARMRVGGTVQGENLDIGFEPVYVEEALDVLDCGTVTLFLQKGHGAPMVIRDGSSLHLIAPKG